MERLADLVQRAMTAKAVASGSRYTVRRLAQDSGMHWTHAANVLRGKRRPTREVLEAWSVALSPDLDLDEALMAAGHPPTDERKWSVVARLWRLGGEQWADLERWIGERVTVSADGPERSGTSEGVAQRGAGDKGEQSGRDDYAAVEA